MTGKLYANFTHELRWKIPKQNIHKLNLVLYQNDDDQIWVYN